MHILAVYSTFSGDFTDVVLTIVVSLKLAFPVTSMTFAFFLRLPNWTPYRVSSASDSRHVLQSFSHGSTTVISSRFPRSRTPRYRVS